MKIQTSIPPKSRVVVFENKNESRTKSVKKLKIIHFNDVYNIEGSKEEPVGGAARFAHLIKDLIAEEPALVVFSGDAFSPSKLSLLAKGQQMVDVLNELNIHAACIGNHEFDMGLDVLENLLEKSKFPWLLSNVFDAGTSKPLLGLKTTLIVNIGGVKVGLFALAEKDWVKSLPCLDYDDVNYESFVHTSRKISSQLREKKKVDIVIALTHMRWKNDIKLANKAAGVDLILGGHDHDYLVKQVNDKWVIKSGTDFKELSLLTVRIGKDVVVDKIEKIVVNSKISEDIKVKNITDKYLSKVDEELKRVLGTVNVALEGRTEIIRKQETNLGNFFCDIMLCGTDAECALLNSGAFRSDRIHQVGEFKLKDLQDILSFDNDLYILNVTGKELHQVLENGVAKYGEGGGRYPQVSGIKFSFDPSKAPLQRVDYKSVKVKGEDLVLDKLYTLVTNNFMKCVDETLKKCPIVNYDDVPMLHCLIENYFSSIIKIKKMDRSRNYITSVVPNYVLLGLLKSVSENLGLLEKIGMLLARERTNDEEKRKLKFRSIALLVCKAIRHKNMIIFKSDRYSIKKSDIFKEKVDKYLQNYLELAPKCEGRSVLIQKPPNEIRQTLVGLSTVELVESKHSNEQSHIKKENKSSMGVQKSNVEFSKEENVIKKKNFSSVQVKRNNENSSTGQNIIEKELTNIEC